MAQDRRSVILLLPIRTREVAWPYCISQASGRITNKEGVLRVKAVARDIEIIVFDEFIPHARSRFTESIMLRCCIDAQRNIKLIENRSDLVLEGCDSG